MVCYMLGFGTVWYGCVMCFKAVFGWCVVC